MNELTLNILDTGLGYILRVDEFNIKFEVYTTSTYDYMFSYLLDKIIYLKLAKQKPKLFVSKDFNKVCVFIKIKGIEDVKTIKIEPLTIKNSPRDLEEFTEKLTSDLKQTLQKLREMKLKIDIDIDSLLEDKNEKILKITIK